MILSRCFIVNFMTIPQMSLSSYNGWKTTPELARINLLILNPQKYRSLSNVTDIVELFVSILHRFLKNLQVIMTTILKSFRALSTIVMLQGLFLCILESN